MGWLLLRKHQDVLSKGKLVDCSDLLRDPIVVLQKRYESIISAFDFVPIAAD